MQLLSQLIQFFTEHTTAFYAVVFVFCACIGSFLNVVIYRLPIMMAREYKQACEEYFECEISKDEPYYQLDKFNLSVPNSACPICKKPIRAWQNIPILSYLFMRGKCAGCNTRISIQYPLVEFLMGLLGIILVWRFGLSLQLLFAIALTAALVALSGIDFKTQLLPDSITLPFLWLGLLISLMGDGVFLSPSQAIIGAVVGYLSLWSVYHLFKLATGKEGMGYGDFKLLAVLGAWLGLSNLPTVIILSAGVGSVIGIGLMVFKGNSRSTAIPFGPYLAIAGWIALVWGEPIKQMYLGAY